MRSESGRGAPCEEDGTPVLDARWVASGLRARVLVPLGIALVVMVIGWAAMMFMGLGARTQAELQKTAASVQAALQDRTAMQVQTLRTASELLMADPVLQSAFRARDREALLRASEAAYGRLQARNDVTQLHFVLPDGTELLRVDAPDVHGDRLDGPSFREAQRTGGAAWGIAQGAEGNLALRLVLPWRIGGELAGYIETGTDFERLAAGLRPVEGVDVLVTLDRDRLDAARWHQAQVASPASIVWRDFPQAVILASTVMHIPPAVRTYLARPARERPDSFDAPDGPRVFRVTARPYEIDRGRVAQLLVVNDITDDLAVRRGALLRIVGLGIAVGGGLMLFFHVLMGRAQSDVQARTARLEDARRALATEQQERLHAQHALAVQQERNGWLERRSRLVEELAEANRKAQEALRENEQVTAALRHAQAQLVATARQAGRAEIATNVLHNVGNVLNSVNVSAGVIASTLRGSRLAGLSRAMELVEQNGHRLGDYLANDPRGRMLPAYLRAATAELGREQDAIAGELARLGKSVEHIRDIVATQQAHARAGYVVEPVEPSELAEEALRMEGSALARHRIEVVREFEGVPALPLDRARVLQVLVNLISNAKTAMAGKAGQGARLTLVVEREGPMLRFRVSDVGEGIPAENLTRIFSHGFTTREDGHGFGLHSCAIAAGEMGGRLTVHSDGPGLGATFALELPLQQASAD